MGYIARRQSALEDQDPSEELAAAQDRDSLPDFDVMDKLMRYENHLNRQIHQNLNKQTQLQTLRYLKAMRNAPDTASSPRRLRQDALAGVVSAYAANPKEESAKQTQSPVSRPDPPASTPASETSLLPNLCPPAPDTAEQTQTPSSPLDVDSLLAREGNPEQTQLPAKRVDRATSVPREGNLDEDVSSPCPTSGDRQSPLQSLSRTLDLQPPAPNSRLLAPLRPP